MIAVCSVCVCTYILSRGFFNPVPLDSTAADRLIAHTKSRKRILSSKTPPCNTMPYIITAFSFPQTLIPPVNTRSLSPGQIIPQSFGGLAELTAKSQLLLESTPGFYKPAYPKEASMNLYRL